MEIDFDNGKVTSLPLDSLGIISSLSKELGIADKINNKLYNNDKRRKVTPGKAVEAMILNTLGFSDRALYLTPHFFSKKPVQQLLGDNIQSEDLNDYSLGHALDEIAEYGCTRLFSEIVFEIAMEKDLLNNVNNVDTTTFSFHGKYDNEEEEENDDEGEMYLDDTKKVNITYGYSKDKRPDLKQIKMSMVMNSKINIPVWVESIDGNSSDKKDLQKTIEKVNKFASGIDMEKPFVWIADSALYNKDRLLKNNAFVWLTRIPGTLSESKEFISKPRKSLAWTKVDSKYKYTTKTSKYGGIEQKWIMYHSNEKHKKDALKFTENYEKELKSIKSLEEKYKDKLYPSVEKCKKEISKMPNFKYHKIIPAIESKGEKYNLRIKIQKNQKEISKKKGSFGRFILGTNDIEEQHYDTEKILDIYKSQQNVERGFKFLKDPYFMSDTFYLKKEERISSLLMIMGLTLFVYNYGQYKLKKNLKENKIQLPNQKGKLQDKISLKWAFKLMTGISILVVKKAGIKQELISKMDTTQEDIIKVLCLRNNIYGIPTLDTS